jgi:hypothetical protein
MKNLKILFFAALMTALMTFMTFDAQAQNPRGGLSGSTSAGGYSQVQKGHHNTQTITQTITINNYYYGTQPGTTPSTPGHKVERRNGQPVHNTSVEQPNTGTLSGCMTKSDIRHGRVIGLNGIKVEIRVIDNRNSCIRFKYQTYKGKFELLDAVNCTVVPVAESTAVTSSFY